MHATANYLRTAQPDGINEVLSLLATLDQELPSLGLPALRNFNYTYFIITRNVRQAVQRGQFVDQRFLNLFDGRFAYYYLSALGRYLQRQAIPPAWRWAFWQAETADCTPFVAMALGVNAHVNNDIALTLRDCDASARHREDYHKVNDIIEASLGEVIDELDAAGKLIDPKRAVLTPVYKLAMGQLIRVWRGKAWHSFERLKSRRTSVGDIERSADKVAERLLMLPL